MGIESLLRRLAPRALKSEMRQKHLAIIWKGKKILAVASNKLGCHAEVAAIKKAAGNVGGATLLSVRLKPWKNTGDSCTGPTSFQLKMAKPCPECMKACQEAGLRRVWWTNREGGLELLFL